MKKKYLTIVIAVLALMLASCTGDKKATENDEPVESQSQNITVEEKNVPLKSDNALFSKSGTEKTHEELPRDVNEAEAADDENLDIPAEESEDKLRKDAWIVAQNVNLRGEPSKEAEIISVLTYGQELAVLDTINEWDLVVVNGIEGYVFAEFVSTEKESPDTTSQQSISPENNQSKGRFTIAIDAGHQAKGNNEMEPIGPGAPQSKAKVASGTQGVATSVPEYKLTLEVSLKLRDELLARGYNAFMIRETHDVNISNKERAVMATEAGADILIRIHADGSENSNVNGILALCPTSRNPYVSYLYAQSRALADGVLSSMVAATGAKNRGVSEVDNMSGINWSTIPVTIVEMGLMTNTEEDKLMQTDEYQQKLVLGMANGIERFFSEQTDRRQPLSESIRSNSAFQAVCVIR